MTDPTLPQVEQAPQVPKRTAVKWTTLDTHAAHEACGMVKLPAPITWTALHKFAEAVVALAKKPQQPTAEELDGRDDLTAVYMVGFYEGKRAARAAMQSTPSKTETGGNER